LKIKVLILILILFFSFLFSFSFLSKNVKAINWDILDNHWININGWTKGGNGISEINPTSQLHQVPDDNLNVKRYKTVSSIPDDYTCEFLQKIDEFGYSEQIIYDGKHFLRFQIYIDKIRLLNNSILYEEYSISTNNSWFKWRILMYGSITNNMVAVYRNDIFIYNFTEPYNYVSGTQVEKIMVANGTTGEHHEDYLKITTGLYIPPEYEITFYFNEGGILRANNITISNTTTLEYENNTVVEFVAITKNSSYIFVSFNYTGGSSLINPFNLTVTGSIILWCYFDMPKYNPISRFTFNPNNPLPEQTVLFNGSDSLDSDGTIINYVWDFNDVNWDILNENWDSLGSWIKSGNGISEISPSGQLHQKSLETQHISRYKILTEGLPSVYTVESHLKIENISSLDDGYKNYNFYNGEYVTDIYIYSDKIKLLNSNQKLTQFNLTTELKTWYIWRFIINNGSLNVYRNSVSIGNVSLYVVTANDGYISTYNSGITDKKIETYEDYFKFSTGSYVPYNTTGIALNYSFSEGIYNVTLIVYDNDGLMDSFLQIIIVDSTPITFGLIFIIISFSIGLMVIGVYKEKKKK